MDKNYNVRENSLVVNGVLLGDIIILNLLYWFFALLDSDGLSPAHLKQTLITNIVIYLLCTAHNGVVLYRRKVRSFQIVSRVLRNMVAFTIISSIVYHMGDYYTFGWVGTLRLFICAIVLISLFRLLFRYFVVLYRTKDNHTHKVVLVGSTDNNLALYNEMTESPAYGYRVMGYFDDEPNDKFPSACPYLGKPDRVVYYLGGHNDIHELYCCLPSKRQNEILPIIHYCVNNLVHFYSVPNVTNYMRHRMYFNMLGNVPYLSLYREPLMNIENRMLKRTFDIAFSAVFLCTLFPIIFVIVAIITKITMPGPIFFKQKRTGMDGKDFYCYKFRSMKVNKDADTVQATKNDPRKTKWGNIMRKTNIDELPQFFNVLIGNMSIVGPRPHMVKQTDDYSKIIDKYMVRHFVKPGITGWSQVTGFRGETKELSQMEGRVEGDIWYIEHWTFWLDLYIMYKTIANAVKGDKEAY